MVAFCFWLHCRTNRRDEGRMILINPRQCTKATLKSNALSDALRDRSFAQTDEEHQAFSDLYHKLIEMHYGGPPDRYFTLKDLAKLL